MDRPVHPFGSRDGVDIIKKVQTKQYLRPENGKDLAYSFEKLIELRERNLSKVNFCSYLILDSL